MTMPETPARDATKKETFDMSEDNGCYEERFAVSMAGMRELHADRPPWMLVKELVQNVWDEAPVATRCEVSVTPAAGGDGVTIVVKDDGPGFVDIRDAWTLMGGTAKRSDPAKRGRFNLGEKEVIAVARSARILTAGRCIEFPPEGGRRVGAGPQETGTTVTLDMPWNAEQARELKSQLRRFRPPADCRLIVNGWETPPAGVDQTVNASLPTVLQDGPGQPMRPTRRRADIHLAWTAPGRPAWLYELGIPVQSVMGPLDIDVQQKVPLPPNRDTVSESYLRTLYALILNAVYDRLERDEFGSDWVKRAIADPGVAPAAVRAVLNGRYGDKVALTSNSADANMKAAEAGYETVNPRSLSPAEREKFREHGGLRTTRQIFPAPELTLEPVWELPEKEHADFLGWARRLAAYAGLDAKMVVIESPEGQLADCTASRQNPTVRFNKTLLPKDFFDPPFGSRQQLELLYHELGHALQDKPMAHGPSWGEGVAQAAGMISSALLKEKSGAAAPA